MDDDESDLTGQMEIGGPEEDGGPFGDVPVVLTVSVGRAQTRVGELLALERNSVVPLDSAIEDPVKIMAGQRTVAYGELQELEGDPPGRLAVRITRIAGRDDTE